MIKFLYFFILFSKIKNSALFKIQKPYKINKIKNINKYFIIDTILKENNPIEINKLSIIINNRNFSDRFTHNLFNDWNFQII